MNTNADTGSPTWRAVTWGDALTAELTRTPNHRGLAAIVEAVDAAAAKPGFRGGRGSYAALVRLTAPPTGRSMCSRAWLTLAALGLDPTDWGLDPDHDDLGPFIDRPAFSRSLQAALWGPDGAPPPATRTLPEIPAPTDTEPPMTRPFDDFDREGILL